jgi:hypothetical protein
MLNLKRAFAAASALALLGTLAVAPEAAADKDISIDREAKKGTGEIRRGQGKVRRMIAKLTKRWREVQAAVKATPLTGKKLEKYNRVSKRFRDRFARLRSARRVRARTVRRANRDLKKLRKLVGLKKSKGTPAAGQATPAAGQTAPAAGQTAPGK